MKIGRRILMNNWDELLGDLRKAVSRCRANTAALRQTSRELDAAIKSAQKLKRAAGAAPDPESASYAQKDARACGPTRKKHGSLWEFGAGSRPG